MKTKIKKSDLRELIIKNIHRYGKPLRWAITKVSPSIPDQLNSQLTIEAVLIEEDEIANLLWFV